MKIKFFCIINKGLFYKTNEIVLWFQKQTILSIKLCKRSDNYEYSNVTNVPHIPKVIKDLGNKSVRAIFLREKI